MKKLFPIAALTLSLTSGALAAPFMAIGDGAELFVTGGLSVRADDNIFLTANETDDIIYEITPGLELTFGKDAQVKGAVTANVAFTNYADNSRLNTTLAGADFFSRYDDGKLKLGVNAAFHELNQNTPDARGLARRDVTTVGGNGEIEMTQLTSVGGGVTFNHENYRRSGYTDSDSLTVPLNLYYKWTPKIDLSVGYSYRDYQVDIGEDSTDHFFNIGARGDFTPKLTGRVAVGWSKRNLSRSGDDDLIGLDASFSYEVSPKTSLQFGASNDFGTSPQGKQQKNFTLNAALMTKLNERWSLNAGGSYRGIDYGTRTDDYWEGTLGATFTLDTNVRVVGGYTYRNYTSPLPGSEFTNNVFSIAANFRY
jgi:hypothetical protein